MSPRPYAEPFTEDQAVGAGWQEVLEGGTVPAGTEFVHVTPGEYIEHIVAVTFRLVTAVAVATRLPVVSFEDHAGVPFAFVPSPSTQVASLTVDYSFAVHANQQAAAVGRAAGGLPDLYLEAGQQVAIRVAAIAGADELRRVRVVVDRYPSSVVRARRRQRRRGELHSP